MSRRPTFSRITSAMAATWSSRDTSAQMYWAWPPAFLMDRATVLPSTAVEAELTMTWAP